MNIFTVKKNVQMCGLIFKFFQGFIVKHLEENVGFKATVLRPEEIDRSSSNFATSKSAPEPSKLSHLGKQKYLETDWAKIN